MKNAALVMAVAGLALTVALRLLNPWFVDQRYAWFGVVGLAPLLFMQPRTAGATCLAWLVVLGWPNPRLDSVRLLVIGLDGATFSSIDPLVGAGQMPNLRALLPQSARAVLVARPPLHSPELWTTIATGRHDHGIDGFRMRATDLLVPRFWDYALDRGLRVGIYKWLVTTPVREVEGFMVPGWEARTAETWPPELGFVKQAELGRRLRPRRDAPGQATSGASTESTPAAESTSSTSPVASAFLALTGVRHGVRLSTLWSAGTWIVHGWLSTPTALDRLTSEQLIRGALDRDVFVWATWKYRPDLATFGYFAIDGLSHRAAHLHNPARGGDPVSFAYQEADTIVGELVRAIPASSSVLLYSDHGSRPLLADEARTYLVPLTDRLQDRLAADVGPVEVIRTGGRLVIFPRDGTDPARLRVAVEGLLDAAGQPVFDAEPIEDALGLSFRRPALSPADVASGTVGGEAMSLYVRLAEDYTGDHDPAGILVVRAPGVAAGPRADPVEQIDVTPTILALLGLPTPAGLLGRAWLVADVPDDGRAPPDPARFQYGSGAGADEESLRALGYVE